MGGGHDDDDLLEALGRLGTDHEPDVAAIRRRVDRPTGQPLGSSLRRNRHVLLAAAAVVLVAGVPAIAVMTLHFGPRDAIAVPGVHASDVGAPTPSPTKAASTQVAATGQPPSSVPTTVPSSDTRLPAQRSSGDRSSPGSGSRTVPAASPTPRAPSDPPTLATAASIAVDTAPNLDVTLAAPDLLDWIAVGVRSDRKQVRAKNAALSPLLLVEQPAGASSVNSPFRLSWTGGLPEQDHTGATRWLSADGATGISITVVASDDDRTLRIYCGAANLGGTVTAEADGAVTGQEALTSHSTQPVGILVSIHVPAGNGPTRVLLDGIPTGPGSAVYLGAVTLEKS